MGPAKFSHNGRPVRKIYELAVRLVRFMIPTRDIAPVAGVGKRV